MVVIFQSVLNILRALLWVSNVDSWILTETPARVDSQNLERYWRRKNNFGKSDRKSKRTKSKSSEKDNVLENINTEQRERKIYSRLIYIHEWSSITKEIIKQGESLF